MQQAHVIAPLFSVVIPTYNRAELLRVALASVWAQRFTDFEVIVVDDGSTDGTVTMLGEYAGRLTLCHQARGGPGAARNLGVSRASGRYLAFLDSDDLWFPWTLETYAGVLARTSQPAMVLGTPAYFASQDELNPVEAAPGYEMFPDYFASEAEWRWWGASAMVVRRDVFTAAGGFSDDWINGEDADLAMRIGTAPGFVHLTAPTTFGYRTHGDSAIASFDRTLAGASHMLQSERDGRYPGGAGREWSRRQIIGRHLRSVMLDALQRGEAGPAWHLYRATFVWHFKLRRWRFLIAFPTMALRAVRGRA